MKLENSDVVVEDAKNGDASKYRSRMKKVAPPPPPVVSKSPPLFNGGSVPLTPGEDCAFDEQLEGRIDLQVILPDLKVVRMTVDRKTPMMDLLVQATTSNKIPPGDHIINVVSKDERNISYKPSTPIGSLDANTVYIIPKSTLELPVKRMPKLANQPFEQQTFRLQVNLPHNQRMVLRVSPRITLAELKSQVCSEKELDHSNHHLVHPSQPDTILDLNATLEVYGCAEISLMSNSGLRDSIRNTSTNIFPVPKIEEEKKKKGILRLFSRRKKDFTVETTNGIHTSRSDTTLNRSSYQPKQSIKRKPAPAPPPIGNSTPPLITQSSTSLNSRPESEISIKTTDEIESSISHSRHSSDSSGYHEPSVFSDCSENKSPEASIVHGDSDATTRQNSPLCKDYPDSSVLLKRSSMTSAKDSNLKNVPSCSNVSISSSSSRKRKAPQPPISTLPAIESPDSPTAVTETNNQDSPGLKTNSEQNMIPSEDSVLQESEAIQFLEDVLQESENCVRSFSHNRILDDSDTESLKDDGEVICQAEVHAHDQDSSDSVVEPLTVVIPDPAMSKSRLDSPPPPDSQPEGYEVVDTSADDSGISHSLTSDADSSVPSLNSDFKTMSDSSCQEDIYCNITGGTISSSFSTPAIFSPRVGSEMHPHVPIPLPRMSLKRKGLISTKSVNSGVYPSCGSLDAESVPSNNEIPVQEHTLKMDFAESENGVDTFSSASSTLGQSTSSTTVNVGQSVPEVINLQKDIPPDRVPEPKSSSSSDWSANEVLQSATSTLLPVDNQEQKCEASYKGSICSSISSDSAHGSASHSPQPPKKLDNFALGCYQKEGHVDIYSIPSPEDKLTNPNNFQSPKKESELTLKRNRAQPDVKIVSLKDQNQMEMGISSESCGNVMEKCAQLSHMSTLPLTGRSSSLFNLTPQQKLQRTVTEMEGFEEVPNGMKRTHSDQNVAQDLEPVEVPQTLLQEQRRLQEEYQHLQEQFISWQKQLMCNQRLLQSENIVPCVPFPSIEGLVSLDSTTLNENSVRQSDISANSFDLRTRSLPRPKTKPLTIKETNRPPTPPLAQPSTASVVDIDIGVQEPVKRPGSLSSCSVDTQVDLAEDKVTQIPSPQDKNTQVPSPQEKTTSGTQAPSPENVLNKDTSMQTSDSIQVSPTDVSSNSPSSPDSEESKSQTLPRPRPKPDSALQPSRTMTLNRNVRQKPQVVSVTIGSWQQRQTPIAEVEPSSRVASTRSKFLSLENIPQSVSKPVLTTMEKRKLPPVPTEVESVEETVPKTVPKSVEARISVTTIPKSEITNTKPKFLLNETKSDHTENKSTKLPSATYSKVSKTVPKQIEETTPKERADIKIASREPTATFKMAKPFVKMSSMKDDVQAPSIVGLRKWPLSEPDSKQVLLDDSKNPSGVQEKIRRAEVDLRKPKSSKTEPSFAVHKPKSTSAEVAPKVHTIKVNIHSQRSELPTEKNNATSRNTNTIPKSQSLNTELMSVFSKRKSKDYEKAAPAQVVESRQTVTVNGSSQVAAPPPPPPPPPPPVPQASSSKMPTIPPAEQIPTSSRLVMAGGTNTLPVTRKESKKNPTKFSRTTDPREELMLEIRGFAGKQALKKLFDKSRSVLKKSPKKKTSEDPSSSSKKQ